ncbi:MAG TPA: PQQ-dependent sugar dehydrogenase [Anaerolineae bacterium]|nr:PQQ-dependent sugar dehydrogenase [Anaerolineae bacterium]
MNRIAFVMLFLMLIAVFPFAPQPLRAAPAGLPPKFKRVALGGGKTLNQPTAIAFPDVRVFVTEKGGSIRVIKADGTLKPTPFHTLSVNSEGERGLLGIALDPNYPSNHYLYVYYTTGPNAINYTGKPENRVSRLFKSPDGRVSEKIIFDHISFSTTHSNHNGGDIHFGFDGKLYISVGENGCCPDAAQHLNTKRGKILRINSDGTIPSDNPFFNTPGGRAIFAYGFRNPWRFTLRASNQTYIVADVGSGTWEEIDWVQRAKNYGWPLYEGPCPSNNLACDPSSVNYNGTVKPIHWYNHTGSGETGNVISGGVFAENSNYPAPYANSYFYGDAGQGWVHVLELNANNQPIAPPRNFDQLNAPVSFGVGKDGNVYVVDFGAGIVYKYVYTP